MPPLMILKNWKIIALTVFAIGLIFTHLHVYNSGYDKRNEEFKILITKERSDHAKKVINITIENANRVSEVKGRLQSEIAELESLNGKLSETEDTSNESSEIIQRSFEILRRKDK